MLTRMQFPASTISLFMSILFLREFKPYINLATNLSITLFLQDIHHILEDVPQKELPVSHVLKMHWQSLDLSAHLGDALKGQIIAPTELQAAISLLLHAEMNKLDLDDRPTAYTIITTLRDFGLSTPSDSSIRWAFLLATEAMPALQGEWRLDFHASKRYHFFSRSWALTQFHVRSPSVVYGHLYFIWLHQCRIYQHPCIYQE